MKIVGLKTAVVEGNFDWTLVRIETDEGVQGLGECFFAPGLTRILRSLEPLLIGDDPREVHRLFRKLQLGNMLGRTVSHYRIREKLAGGEFDQEICRRTMFVLTRPGANPSPTKLPATEAEPYLPPAQVRQ